MIKNSKGQSLLEYVILVALVAMVSISATKLLGKQINGKIEDIKEKIESGIPVRLSPK